MDVLLAAIFLIRELQIYIIVKPRQKFSLQPKLLHLNDSHLSLKNISCKIIFSFSIFFDIFSQFCFKDLRYIEMLLMTRYYIILIFFIHNFLLKSSCADENCGTMHLVWIWANLLLEPFSWCQLKLRYLLLQNVPSSFFFQFSILYILVLWGWVYYKEEMQEICDWEAVKCTLESLGWKTFCYWRCYCKSQCNFL